MTLREHQLDGVAFLTANPKGYLAHKPGLGKTRTLIAAMQLNGIARPLIVCPAIVRTHWWREMKAMDYAPDARVRSYDEIVRGGSDVMNLLLPGTDALILDEAHALKHGTSKRTKAILGRDGYARRIPTVWAASGTPLPRNPAEIWTLLASVFPWLPARYGIKTYAQFVARYCYSRNVPDGRGGFREKIVGINHEHEAELRAMLGEIMQVREPGDDMPAIDWQMLPLDGARIVVDNDLVDTIAEGIDTGLLAEIENDPHIARMRRRIGELKAPLVAELLKSQLDADPEMKVAVFAHHRSVLADLRIRLEEFGVSYIDGDTTPVGRDIALAQFQENPNVRVFIGQNIACKEGMDGLQHATNRAVLVEPDWTASVNEQLGKRVARMGSAHDHAIVQMVALAGTLDEAIVRQNQRETEMVARAMPAGVQNESGDQGVGRD